jgi:hypothetical protein
MRSSVRPAGIEAVVFLNRWPVSRSRARTLGVECLRRGGLDVVICDLSPMVNADVALAHPEKDPLSAEDVRVVADARALEALVAEWADRALFVDFVVGTADIDPFASRVFRILAKHGAAYCVVSGGDLPVAAGGARTGRVGHVVNRLRGLGLRGTVTAVGTRIIRLLRTHTRLYAAPVRIYGTSSERLQAFMRRHGIPDDAFVPIDSLDHDTFLRYRRGHSAATPARAGTAVFLEEGVTGHRDFTLLGIQPVPEGPYLDVMRRLFDEIEERTGLRVVVAAHPDSGYVPGSKAFGDREIVRGRTVELVAESDLVIAHLSTAVSFAVLFRKPLLFVVTETMVATGYAGQADAMAGMLGLPVLRLREHAPLPAELGLPESVPEEAYRSYEYRYLASPGVEDMTFPEIVVRDLTGKRVECEEGS